MRALGRYELIRPLARGGMAEVFLARRRGAAGVEKRLVIKRIRPERANDPRFLELFVREARLSMSLTHQNIVPMFDFGRAGGELFLAMEYVDGRDLASALELAASKRLALDPLLVAHIGIEASQGLSYAHDKRDREGRPLGVVHRDVSPRNVLLSRAGEVKLVDFGVASLHGDATGRVRGTPAYMAPEQARGEAVDGRCDIYALGVVLWEAVAGRRAFPGVEAAEALATARQRTLPSLPAGVPAELAAVITRATAADAAARWPDARALRRALDTYVVAARAARPELPAPAEALASWLRDLEQGEPVVPEIADGAALDDVVTFMDDGEAEVLGQSTQKSIAETVADAPAPVAPPTPAATPGPASPAAAALSAPVPASTGPGHRARLALIAGLIGAGVITTLILWRPIRRARQQAPVAGTTPTPSPSVSASPAASPSSSPSASASASPSASASASSSPSASSSTSPSASSSTSPAASASPRPTTSPSPSATASASASPRPAAVLRKVTINSRPWSNFYVDKDRTAHETPETVELAPGRHTIRFVNADAHLDKTISLDVPADRDLTHLETLLAAP